MRGVVIDYARHPLQLQEFKADSLKLSGLSEMSGNLFSCCSLSSALKGPCFITSALQRLRSWSTLRVVKFLFAQTMTFSFFSFLSYY